MLDDLNAFQARALQVPHASKNTLQVIKRQNMRPRYCELKTGARRKLDCIYHIYVLILYNAEAYLYCWIKNARQDRALAIISADSLANNILQGSYDLLVIYLVCIPPKKSYFHTT